MKTCKKCGIEKPLDEFHKKKLGKNGRMAQCRQCYNMKRRASYTPPSADEREKRNEYGRQWYKSNKNRHAEMSHVCYERNKENILAKQKDRLDEIAANRRAKRRENPELARKKDRKNYAKHKDSIRVLLNSYQSKFRKQCPVWADRNAIKTIYARAREMTQKTGIQYHVDHIIPLNGDLVSGLHVAENLQIITSYENQRKGNRIDLGV